MTYYEMQPLHPIMESIKKINSQSVLLASMNEVIKSDESHPLLGTYALATCFCLIIYDKKDTYLIHTINDYEVKVNSIIESLGKNKKCILIPGLYTEMTKIAEVSLFLKRIEPHMEIQVLNLSEFINDDYESIEFLYDTQNKEFIKPNFNELLGKGR